MPDLFHNPYHFVPLGPGMPPEPVPLGEFVPAKAGEPAKQRQYPHLTHDRFVAGKHSGRIVCKVTVETPLICGNSQDDNESQTCKNGRPNPRYRWTKLLNPFELKTGEPALAGSALRGMLSALVEAASHSAMRVLENRPMSYRRQVSEGLSAIGMIVEAGNGTLHIFPLASPHLDRQTLTPLPRGDHATYTKMFPSSRPKVYFGTPNEIATPAFLNAYKSNSAPTGGPFYAVDPACLVDKVKGGHYWLGQMINAPDRVRLWADLSEAEKSTGKWMRGILRVLGKYAERADALPTKKHEYFLYFSDLDEAGIKTGSAKLFPIDPEALTRFNDLADERADTENGAKTDPKELLPYTPHGTLRPPLARNSDRPESSWQLKPGDIVFFRPSIDGLTVVEVSLSSAWRGRVEQNSPLLSPSAPTNAFFDLAILPLTRGRTLTLAEQLFGVVEIQDKKEKKALGQKSAFALGSRLRVSHATLHSAPQGGAYQPASELLSQQQRQAIHGNVKDVPLQNLASPKLPSPAMYFKKKNGAGAYIPKKSLNPVLHAPQGRKFYLRRNPDDYSATTQSFVHPLRLTEPDEISAIARQHQSVKKFVRPGSTFYFHLDFDNLSDLELQLVAYALQPTPTFRHQIGHGKPLGLGQLKIEIAGLLEVTRNERYKGTLTASRWHHAWAMGAPMSEWPEALKRHLPVQFSPLQEKLGELKSSFEKWAQPIGMSPVLRAIELIGTPLPAGAKVHYPQANQKNLGNTHNPTWVDIKSGDAEFEEKLYEWFVQNDDSAQGRNPGQFLRPLLNEQRQVAEKIPSLDRAQCQLPPPLKHSGVPQTAGPGGGGGGNAGATPTNPSALAGRPAKARVAAHEKAKGKVRIRFTVTCGGFELRGYLQQPDPNVDKQRYPDNPNKEFDFILVNPRKIDGAWQCELRRVA